MTTTPPSDERSGSATGDEAYGALRASAAMWAGTSVDQGESPAHAAARRR
ncbi:hypothetical protein [Streptomyces sp. NPDC001770]